MDPLGFRLLAHHAIPDHRYWNNSIPRINGLALFMLGLIGSGSGSPDPPISPSWAFLYIASKSGTG
jgi:hypothetical protein